MKIQELESIDIRDLLESDKDLRHWDCKIRIDNQSGKMLIGCYHLEKWERIPVTDCGCDGEACRVEREADVPTRQSAWLYIKDMKQLEEGSAKILRDSCIRIPLAIDVPIGTINDFILSDDLLWVCMKDKTYVYRVRNSDVERLQTIPIQALSLSVSQQKHVYALTLDKLYVFDARGKRLRDMRLKGFHFDMPWRDIVVKRGFLGLSRIDGSDRVQSFIRVDRQNNIYVFAPGYVKKYSPDGELLRTYYYNEPADPSKLSRKPFFVTKKNIKDMMSIFEEGFCWVFKTSIEGGTINTTTGNIYTLANMDWVERKIHAMDTEITARFEIALHVMNKDLEHRDHEPFPLEIAPMWQSLLSMDGDDNGTIYCTVSQLALEDEEHHHALVPEIKRCTVTDVSAAGSQEPLGIGSRSEK